MCAYITSSDGNNMQKFANAMGILRGVGGQVSAKPKIKASASIEASGGALGCSTVLAMT
ncbi:hypothetical protein ACCAA_350123 [Candidatus Accumulibacter aalborgensis]|uniref:Uncharacterized protein n=1 Tax=Candidatus Accumulibacter aalborgensis TaxID=1860102 RepID=A0A1A8XNL5_9PROT|nr:hypothetical protein ACCAA_350123 [Candidatus Accumulibacter aalborgensis]